MIATGAPNTPVHIADQFAAATGEVREIADRLGTLLPILDPSRTWRQRVDADPSDEVRAHLLAVVLGCVTVCPHLRRGGPQVAIVRLALGRTDCVKCSATFRHPPAEDEDRCDLCGTRGIAKFWPFAMRQGPTLVSGNCCASCADILGISGKAMAS
jgi:DNA-directed RNA polymerase subunit RPC12/RpoP